MRRRYKNNSNRKLSDQRRKELAQKRSDNINKLNEQESLLDKYLLAITSFMFNAILFFVNSIVKLETAIYIGWFYFAIICSVCSILTIIISIVRSNYILNELSHIINKGLESNTEPYQEENDYLKKRKFFISKCDLDKYITFNHASAVLVCISIISISLFMYCNIDNLRNNALKSEEQEMSQKNNQPFPEIKSYTSTTSNAPKPTINNSGSPQSQSQTSSQTTTSSPCKK